VNSFEWLETDGLGGFAMGNSELIPERKYHALLSSAKSNSVGRETLVLGVEVYLQTATELIPIQGFRYKGGVVHPNPSFFDSDVQFTSTPCPSWIYHLPAIGKVEFSILMLRGESCTILNWKTESTRMDLKLKVRPFLVCRDLHALRRESKVREASEKKLQNGIQWTPFEASAGVIAVASGEYRSEPYWYRDIYFCEEESRGYENLEDAYSPGEFILPFANSGATLALSSETDYSLSDIGSKRESELKRRATLKILNRASEHYLIKKTGHSSLVAGYPWFDEWGRDTFIALRGLILPFKRFSQAEEIIYFWSSKIKNGLIPNYFDEGSGQPFYNSVDASLWFVISAFEFLKAARLESFIVTQEASIIRGIKSIVQSFIDGTVYGIKMDADFLLNAGDEGVQLTWMDAKIGDRVITPRRGKPVEVQALWINSLRAASQLLKDVALESMADEAQRNFNLKFWSEKLGYFFDVIDCKGQKEQIDTSLRPNQLFALGGLPFRIVEDSTKVIQVLRVIESTLLTPHGLRTLSPKDARYEGTYKGDQSQRDLAYHQGSVWPWLIGAFVDAWLYSRGYSAESKYEAKRRFVDSLLRTVMESGMAPELCDGNPPFTHRGCPFQAWSLGEIIRSSEACEHP